MLKSKIKNAALDSMISFSKQWLQMAFKKGLFNSET